MKCEMPALASVSSREPAPIQNPIETERTGARRSEMTRSPESSAVSTEVRWPRAPGACSVGASLWCARGSSAGGVGTLVPVGEAEEFEDAVEAAIDALPD